VEGKLCCHLNENVFKVYLHSDEVYNSVRVCSFGRELFLYMCDNLIVAKYDGRFLQSSNLKTGNQ